MADGQVQQMQQDGTQAQILMRLGELSTSMAVITTKVDQVIANTSDHEGRLRTVETSLPVNLESRLGALESFKAKTYGVAATTGVLSGGVATLIYWALSNHHH